MSEEPKQKQVPPRLREALAIVVWLYAITKLFIFDIDVQLMHLIAPRETWLLNLRFPAIAAVLVASWWLVGHRRFFLLLAYVVGYPLIVVFWKIPKLIWKRWAIFIILTPTIYTTIVSLRTTLALMTAALIATVIVALSTSPGLLIPAMAYLGVFLVIMLARAFTTAHSSSIFSQLAELARKLHPKISSGALDQPLPTLQTPPGEGEEQTEETTETEGFPQLYLLHAGADFIAQRVDEVARERKYNILLALSLIYVFALSVIVFALLNWGLFKLDPTSFTSSHGTGVFQFIAYSFGRLANSDMFGMRANTNAAVAIAIAETAFGLLILVIGAFSFLTAFRDTYREDFQEFDRALHETASVIDDRIRVRYEVTAADLELAVSVHSAQLVNFLRRIRGLPEIEQEEGEVNDTPAIAPPSDQKSE